MFKEAIGYYMQVRNAKGDGVTLERSEARDTILNWLAGQFRVQPTFSTPWIPLELDEWFQTKNFIDWVAYNLGDFVQELCEEYGLPTKEQSLELINQFRVELANIPEGNFPKPILSCTPDHTPWLVLDYLTHTRTPDSKALLYVIEHDICAYRIAFLLNAIHDKPMFILYYPIYTDDALEGVKLLQPTDLIWDYANLWSPSVTKLRKAQDYIVREKILSK